MTDPDLPPPVWVDTPAGLAALVADLSIQPAIAVDTESNSLHAYREQVCLIQFSTPQIDYLLDPLAISDTARTPPLAGHTRSGAGLQSLAPIFADPNIEKVFHAAEYDLICLSRDFGWQVRSLFDTMVAVRTLGWPSHGLAAVLESQFGVKLNKRHQRANWAARPLTPDQLAYARLDTHYLIPLRHQLRQALDQSGYWAEAKEEFDRLCQINGLNGRTLLQFDPQNFWHISGARDLAGREAATLRELYIYRDQCARRLNRPPFKVISDSTLLAIAKAQPHSLADLAPLPGMTPNQIHRHGHPILQTVARGHKAPIPRPLRIEHEDEAVLERYEALRKWRKQKAQKRGVESDVIIPRDVLLELARRAPQSAADLNSVPGLGPTRRAKYGDEIVQLLNPQA
ncbi:MAG TPA: HRDC domain-containing protein [Anaerolineales bacterium]|nr:HRDC domain-containing protein [Anaerolineales bacterium]